MANYSKTKAIHATLSGTTADTVAITGYDTVDVINRDASNPLYVAYEGDDTPVTAVAAADDTAVVAPGGFIRVDANGTGGGKLSIVGSGNAYSVVGVSA